MPHSARDYELQIGLSTQLNNIYHSFGYEPSKKQLLTLYDTPTPHQSCAWQHGVSLSWKGSASEGPLHPLLYIGQLLLSVTSRMGCLSDGEGQLMVQLDVAPAAVGETDDASVGVVAFGVAVVEAADPDIVGDDSAVAVDSIVETSATNTPAVWGCRQPSEAA